MDAMTPTHRDAGSVVFTVFLGLLRMLGFGALRHR